MVQSFITEYLLKYVVRRPIKHVIDTGLTDVNGTNYSGNALALVKGVAPSPDPYAVPQNQVNAGSAIVSHLKIWMDLWINNKTTASTGALANLVDFYIWFNIAGGQTRPSPQSIGTSDLKNQVFHTGSTILGSSAVTSNQLNIADYVRYEIDLVIPKWAQKINKDDQIELVTMNDHADLTFNMKLKVIFMEYEQS